MEHAQAWDHHTSIHGQEVCWPRTHSNRNYGRLAPYAAPKGRSRPPVWILVWRKIKKEKQRVFQSTSPRFTYDPHSYSQNFDEGFMWTDADHLSRSFSARFAVNPSKIFDKNTLVV